MRRSLLAVRVAITAALVLLLVLPTSALAATPDLDVTASSVTDGPGARPQPAEPRDQKDSADNAPEPAATPSSKKDSVKPPPEKKQQKQKVAPLADDAPRSRVGVTKETSLGDDPLTPGREFTYIITVRCSGLTVGCVNQQVTDVLPAGLEVTSLPQATGARSVAFDESTRELSIGFTEDLQAPVGAKGLNDGATRVIEIGVRLPADTSLAGGTSIPNKATTTADNADPDDSAVNVTVSIPREVRPVVTKTWTDGSAVAGSGEESRATLGVRNASTGSAVVSELILTDATAATYENFDLTGVRLLSFPAGADRAQLLVCTQAGSDCDPGDYTAGAAEDSAGVLGLPSGIDIADVTGFRVRFFAASGSALPYDATGGKVEAGYVLRDTSRSDGDPIKPTTKQTVRNCAVPAALDDDGESVSGSQACANYDILPDTVLIAGSKSFFPDTNGDFSKAGDEYAVVGEHSPVSATVGVKNNSAFALRQISIVEPDSDGAGVEFDKLDVTQVRLRFPQGATTATLKVEYDDPALNTSTDHTSGTTVNVVKPGARVTRVEVVYTGDVGGSPSIAVGSTAYLDLHGTLNDDVTNDDLPNGDSPGVGNCALFKGSAETLNSTGAATGNVCATLPVEAKRLGGQGVKSNGQNDIPPGQPIPFTLDLRNNGNVPLIDPVLTDPPTDTNDIPVTANNPFAVVRLTAATITKDSGVPGVDLEVYDPQAVAWVAYNGADADLLTRATGVRASLDGALMPTKKFTVNLTTERREDVPDGAALHNCFTASAADWVTAQPICSAAMKTGPAESSAVINKSIAPGTLPAPIPGVSEQTADVTLTVANTGNVNAKRLVLTDDDVDFFDAVKFGSISAVAFPSGANRIQVDALTDEGWTEGTPRAQGGNYPLPAGVDAAGVIGIRITFTHSSGDYTIRPCEGKPAPTWCTGKVTLTVHPLQKSRSTGNPIPAELTNTLTGGYEALTHDPGHLQPADPVDADLKFVEGDAELDVNKTPNTAISPGETAPFRLTVTNSGTSNLPKLVVKDALPAGLEFDETFAGDDGQPFKIVNTHVPDGTDPVPAPEFTTTSDAGHVSGLQWSFGDWVFRPGATFTIEIQVTLAPGVTEGQVNTNTMGASSSNPKLECADGTGTDPDDLFGGGTWCTDTAAVTTKAGAAFQARKWVGGNDDLGWFNNRTKRPVAVGDDSCPVRVEGGRTYTAFPCVALVNPGDEYDYLLRMVNAGTEPATDMRIIDRFPVQGDKGVVLDDIDRGTQWIHRPTLASQPRLLGNGTLTTTYANNAAGYCASDLDMGSSCGAGTWADPYSADAMAAQMRVAWHDPLAPGDGVSIAFSMRTPLDVAQVDDPTIAWNSFGHAEKTIRGNGSRVLPPTEPIQVGVATAYGTLKVVKEITENPGGLPVADREFGIDYACTIDPIGGKALTVAEGTLQVKPGNSKNVTGIPAGATCKVWESDAAGGVTNHPADDPAEVRITAQMGEDPVEPVTVTVENSYPLASLDITKVVDGEAAVFGKTTTYPIEVTCSMADVIADGFPQTVQLTGDDTTTIEAPVGSTCTAVETDDGGATRTAVTPKGGVTITGETDATFELTATNAFDAAHLRILKKLDGAGADLPDGPFVFEVACTFEGRDIDPITVTLQRHGRDRNLSADVDGVLPVGAECLVTETDNGGADATPDPVTIALVENDDDNTVTAAFTNEFSAATVALEKIAAGEGAQHDYVKNAIFTINVTCAIDDPANIVYSRSVQIKAGQRVDLEGVDGDHVMLPLGTRCWAGESDPAGATKVQVNASSWDEALRVTSGTPDDLQLLTLKATNTFDAATLKVTKKVVGGGSGPYHFETTCSLDGHDLPLEASDAAFSLKADHTRTIHLIEGADCAVTEVDVPKGATVSFKDSDGKHDGKVHVNRAAQVTVTNTFPAASAGSALPGTGGPTRAWIIAAVVLIGVGGAMTGFSRKRRNA